MSSDSRRSSALVSAGILLSRIAGLARERAVSHFLGLGFAAEAFAAAFRIPNILQNLLGEGVLSASFIPVHVRLIDQGRDEEARQLAGTVLGLLTATAGGVALLLMVLAAPLASVLLLGREPAMQELVASLLRVIAPGLALLVVSAWCLGILNSHRRFFLSYVAPVVWNLAQVVVVVVAGILLLDGGGAQEATQLQSEQLAGALAWGTLIGGALQVAVQVPTVRSLTPGLRPRLSPIGPHTREVLRAFAPVVTGRGVVQLATFVDLVLASVLVGSVLATLMKVQTLAILPVSLFGMAVAAAELPDLSSADRSDRLQIARRIDAGMGRIAFYVLPTAVGFLLVGDLIVGLLFRSGAFGAPEVRIVWVVLMGATFGLLATTSSRLLQSVLYGGGDTRGPARIAIVRVTLAAAAGFLLMVQLDRVVLSDSIELLAGASLPAFTPLPSAVRASSDLVHLGALGLTLASSIAAVVEYRLLRELVTHRVGATVRLGGPQRARLAIAAVASAAAAMIARPLLVELSPVVAGIAAIGVVGTVHVGVAVALGVEEARALLDTARRTVRRR